MESDASPETFRNYFEAREVQAADYSGYVIPTWAQRALPRDKTARIVDLGCGLGQTLQAAKRLGFSNLRGCDMSPSAVESCRSRGLNVDLIDGDIAGWISKLAPVEFVSFSHVLEHLPKDQVIPTLRAIRESLSDSGVLWLQVPNAMSATGSYWAYEDFTHETLFTPGSLLFVLKQAGFTKIEFQDPDGTSGLGLTKKFLRKLLLAAYRLKTRVWIWATASSYHRPSPRIYTYELKVLASKGS